MERERQAQRQAISCQSCEVIREGFSSGTVTVQPGTRVSQLREVRFPESGQTLESNY
jgi:hypothetical protein